MTINTEYLSVPDHPKPRLCHIESGQFFTLLHRNETHRLLRKDDLYGYIEYGRIGLSTELNPETMAFGDGDGWRKRK